MNEPDPILLKLVGMEAEREAARKVAIDTALRESTRHYKGFVGGDEHCHVIRVDRQASVCDDRGATGRASDDTPVDCPRCAEWLYE